MRKGYMAVVLGAVYLKQIKLILLLQCATIWLVVGMETTSKKLIAITSYLE